MSFEKLKEELEGQVFTDDETLSELQKDFGRLTARMPGAVVIPANERDVCRLLQISQREDWTVTTRGASHSQGGQSLTSGGILLDLTSLNRIERIERHAAWVQAGVLWNDLIHASLEERLAPPVLTTCLDVTVGGTISTGGWGASSFRLGPQARHVEEMEVVTGEGHLVRCSPEENRELFDSARAGLGQFCVITRAKIGLRTVTPHVRTFYLLYDDLRNLMRDLELLLGEERFDYLECFAVPCPLGFTAIGETQMQLAEWFYLLKVSTEFGHAPHEDSLLNGLKFFRHSHTQDRAILDFFTRSQPMYSWWQETGTWAFSHPWMETFLPWDKAAPYIQGVLRSFPSNLLAGGQVAILPLQKSKSELPLLMLPEADRLIYFGLLPAVARQFLPMVLPLMIRAGELSVEMGGKRHLSGWVGYDHDQWKAHFGPKWKALLELKRFFDPKKVLNPLFIQYEK
jgi:cytokinin dehydrogenase